ncbi:MULTISPECIES: N-formylglutamate amidohydrolase [unclassified Ensifer]|uniref:N-formylglutamate amidohydrolase n=1 Tax=unclassified Ensifer TaxID=2633371 RepID=UPI00087E8AC8|nr:MULTISPECIES: N-formylglutamate amidohydrolase [unclassified Ensifer]MCY1739934.1 N-formylglutamate amidohydrolase [Ensifer sp. SL37]SDM31958.1 N-formylglutamate amidohydrolase [Ensifer sp. YR511]
MQSEPTEQFRSASETTWWTAHRGDGPIVGTAIHNGHAMRSDARALTALTDEERLREEDPFTEFVIRDLANRIVVHRSRFEVDLNRARTGAVYLQPAQAWGLSVWREHPPVEMIEASLAVHDEYYAMLHSMLTAIERRHGRFIVLDMHSYNHRRQGPDAAPAAPDEAPEINIGTSSMDRLRWAGVIDTLMSALGTASIDGRPVDVRENVAFQGRGEQTRFIHEHFPETGCAIAIEFKKTFMDEWTGKPDIRALRSLRALVSSLVPILTETLARQR